jgi:hypothetical protein
MNTQKMNFKFNDNIKDTNIRIIVSDLSLYMMIEITITSHEEIICGLPNTMILVPEIVIARIAEISFDHQF